MQLRHSVAWLYRSSTKRGLLILDWNVAASRTLVLAADEVGNLLVLGLLDSRLIVLSALAEKFLLDEIDAPRDSTIVRHRVNRTVYLH